MYLLLVGCQAPVPSGERPLRPFEVTLSGRVEKGPFVPGSSVTVAPLDEDGQATGESFATRTEDDAGRFSVAFDHRGLASVMAEGFYYDEVSASLSGAPLTLRALHEVVADGPQDAVVNLFTHLAYDRAGALTVPGRLTVRAQVQELHACRSRARSFVAPSRVHTEEGPMRKLIVHEFVTLDGVMQAPGGPDEDRDGGFAHGGWTRPYWHDDIGATFGALMQGVDAFLLGRRTYVTHAEAFEPMPVGDPFGDLMNAPAKYVVSKTLGEPIWRNTTILRDDVVGAVQALKAGAGGTILCDGSSQLVHALIEHDLVDELFLHVYPLALGAGKRVFPSSGGAHRFALAQATPYPTGVVGLRYTRAG